MNQEGHIGLSMFLATPIALVLGLFGQYGLAVAFTLAVIWFSTLPDIDIVISRSFINNFIGLQHRGFTHTIYFGILCGVFTAFIGLAVPSYHIALSVTIMFLAGFLGVIFHIIGDIMTPSGINYDPRSMESAYSLDWFNYNNFIGNFGFLTIGFLSLASTLILISDPIIEATILLLICYTVGLYVVVKLAKSTEFRYNRSFLGKINNISFWIKKLK